MRNIVIIMLAFLFTGFTSVAVAGPFDTTVPKQSMHSTDGSDQTTVTPSNEALSSPKKNATVAAKANANANASPSGIDLNANTVKQMQQQLQTMNQQFLLFQQRTDQRIENLTAANTSMQSQLTDMNQALRLISTEIQQLRSKGSAAQLPAQVQPGLWSSLQARFGNKFFYIVIVALLLMLVLLFMLFRPATKKDQVVKTVENDTEEEYDFMGSPEGVAAKLDLARAYLAMQDFQQMRAVLQQVLQQGNTQQKHQAQELLEKIPEQS